MSNSPEELQRRIAELEAQLRALQAATTPTSDSIAGDKVAGDKVAGDKIVDPQLTLNIGAGVAVGLNLGRIVYGRDPAEEERRRLVWYLEGLASQLYYLPLRGLDERLSRGEGLSLPHVYVTLATNACVRVDRGGAKELRRYFQDGKLSQPLKAEYDPNYALPNQAVTRISPVESLQATSRRARKLRVLERASPATEAVHQHARLVLLGDPGSGKSTFVRHLAWALAQYELNPAAAPALFGWAERRPCLPLLLPLRALAIRLARDGVSDATVYAALRDAMQACCTHQVDDALSEALHRGAALLLFDGLDEVPLEKTAEVADRLTTLRAVHRIARRYSSCRVVLTCRTRPFDQALRAELGWHVETIAPFTLGQVRHFIPCWYDELVAKGQITRAQAANLGTSLLQSILDPARPRLREMAAIPLLLTLMALVLYNKGELPRDRPQLYERVMELLLGQWDQVRDGPSLGHAIGKPEWDSSYFRPPLDQLSYAAHRDVRSADGRGRLDRGRVFLALHDFFKQAKITHPGDAADSCLEYIEQRSGLLAPDDNDSYVFAHLTLQEHCAGRHLAFNTDDPVAMVMRHRGDDRWREPIMLGMGLVQPLVLDRLLANLIDRHEARTCKPVERWYRDLILAAEIGADRDWDYLSTRPMVNVDRLQQDLRCGLVALLQDPTQPLPVAERVRAGFLLGDLGDPRFPITTEQWRAELAKINAGDPTGYFCPVAAGTYTIGSADADPDAGGEEMPQHTVSFGAPFWIARFPICNAQWQRWVEQAVGQASFLAGETNFNCANQPIVAVNWHMCNAFCSWLSACLGVTVRLPNEQEWEAAARGGDARRYPWGDDWQDDRAATEEGQETRAQHYSVPVGCYPAGAAPCGALDMAGNVWEWTASALQPYQGRQKRSTADDPRVLRGGSWSVSRNSVRCAARFRILPVDDFIFSLGLRIIVVAQ